MPLLGIVQTSWWKVSEKREVTMIQKVNWTGDSRRLNTQSALKPCPGSQPTQTAENEQPGLTSGDRQLTPAARRGWILSAAALLVFLLQKNQKLTKGRRRGSLG